MLRANARGALLIAGIGIILSSPGCGKKAPLRLIEDRPAEHAPALRARIREGLLTLDFRVPAHRAFPEREEPWVLARILRQTAPSSGVVEAGAILKSGGFPFDSPLSWSEQVQPSTAPLIYRVEFRDGIRRRRALSEPLTVAWGQLPAAPSNLTAAGHLRSILLTWDAPNGEGEGIGYRIYRRETAQTLFELAAPDPVAGLTYVDSRIEPGHDYCYVVRAVLNARALEAEGPASSESCSRSASDELPLAQPPASRP